MPAPATEIYASMSYVERIGVTELRQNASAVLRRVAAGEVIEVTDRGRAVARIVPIHEASRLEQLQAAGRASRALGDLLDVKPIRRVAGKALLSEILAEIATEER
jgi:prevent-host-death family protein